MPTLLSGFQLARFLIITIFTIAGFSVMQQKP